MFYLGGDEGGETVTGICCMKTIFSIKQALLITNTHFRQTHLTTLTQSLILSKASHSYPLWSSPLLTWGCFHNRPSKTLLSSKDSHHWTIGSMCRWLSPRNNHETTFSLQTPMAILQGEVLERSLPPSSCGAFLSPLGFLKAVREVGWFHIETLIICTYIYMPYKLGGP